MTLLAPPTSKTYLDLSDALAFEILIQTLPPGEALQLQNLVAEGNPASQLRALYKLPVLDYVRAMAKKCRQGEDETVKVWELTQRLDEIISWKTMRKLFNESEDDEETQFEDLPDDVYAYAVVIQKCMESAFSRPTYIITEPIDDLILRFHMLSIRDKEARSETAPDDVTRDFLARVDAYADVAKELFTV